jgi:hypothetical protein
MPQKHSTLTANHRPYAATYADAAARLAATGFPRGEGGAVVTFASEDLYKSVLQLSDHSEWVLTATTPAWVQVGGPPAVSQVSGLVSGGQVTWDSAYTFRVAAATYLIRGTQFTSAEQTVTLDAAHATLNRIDVLALNTSGTLVKVSGTAAAQPSEPDIDPSTQVKLTFVIVEAASTAPAGVANENVYLENAEWTSSTSGSGWDANSTSNPRTGTKTIEGTTVANGAYVQLQRASSTALDSFLTLRMFVRSKAAWSNGRVLRLQFFLAGVAKGVPVTLASGYWGFDSSITSGYQLVAIPVSQFALPAGTLVNQLRIADAGGSIGLYIDDIVVQSGGTSVGGSTSGGMTQEQADARYLQRSNNLSDLVAAAEARVNLATSPAPVTLVDGATVTWATAGQPINNAQVTLGGNRTLDITGEVAGATGVLVVIQDATGSRTLALPGSSKVIGGGAGAVTLTTTANARDILSWYYDGTFFYWTKGLNFT